MKLTPLRQWICDTCGEIIKSPEEGWFEWYDDRKTSLQSGFRIVHHRRPCMYDEGVLRQQGKLVSDLNLTTVIGSDGLGNLLFHIELSEKGVRKLKNLNEFIEILRRLHIPYWEEARLCWEEAYKDGFHDKCSFDEEMLLSIISEYGKDEEVVNGQ